MAEQMERITIEIDASLQPVEPPLGRVSDFFDLSCLIPKPFIKWECPEGYYFSLKSERDGGFVQSVYNGCCHTNPNLDRLYLADPLIEAGVGIENMDKIALTVIASPNGRFESVKMRDVEKKFKGISQNGCLHSVHTSKNIGDSSSHSQGSNVYIDTNGKRHFIVANDNQTEKGDLGYIVIFSEPLYEKKEPIIIRTDAGGYNHPGSFQIIGDYLFLPIEHYVPVLKRKKGSVVYIYDLTPLSSGSIPKLCSTLSFDDHRAGMLGLTDKWLAIHDEETTYLYQIKSFSGSTLKIRPYGNCKTKSFHGIGLVQQITKDGTEDGLYLIGLTHKEVGYKDYMHLCKIKPTKSGSTYSFECEDVLTQHVYTDHGRGEGGINGIHFRYGGGVYLTENAIVCLGTGRNIRSKEPFNFNTFSNTNRIEVNCGQKKLSGQDKRCSQNFSLKGFKDRCGSVKFTILKDGAICSDIKINVAKDKTGKDSSVYTNIGVDNAVHKLNTDSPLYFYSPEPSKDCSIVVVVEENTE